jgi:cation-transporting ATPase 13A3/4/5
VQNTPFYVPPYNDGGDTITTINVVSYEATVLFYIANFQYLMTCISFSISKPFRKELWTNRPYFISVILLIIFNSANLFVPGNTPVFSFFSCLPFVTEAGVAYYQYRYFIAVGILLNSIITYVAEKFIIEKVTKRFDRRKERKRYRQFDAMMAEFEPANAKKHIVDQMNTGYR